MLIAARFVSRYLPSQFWAVMLTGHSSQASVEGEYTQLQRLLYPRLIPHLANVSLVGSSSATCIAFESVLQFQQTVRILTNNPQTRGLAQGVASVFNSVSPFSK